ncbi:MAG: CRISPR-associated protein Cas5 [Bacillota bacterium]|jgi:CRISPR-associated protein Cas5t|nr:CRISPR-associated protein Cas5 [Clostridia bacterium]
MEVLRIKLTQNQAHYRKEETITNKMTYPLPPLSTVIGALCNACGYTEYHNKHEMDISIQGRYQSMQREVYTDQAFLNSVMDDRGILVKLQNPNMLSAGYHVVARAQKPQGNSFRDGKTIEVIDQSALMEYRELLRKRKLFEEEKKNMIDPQIKSLDEQQRKIKAQQKDMDKKSKEFLALKQSIEKLKQKKKSITEEFKKRKEEQYGIPYSFYASLTTSIRYYEVLYGVELILHISSNEETLNDIENNIHDLKAIGRSEDFVHVEEIKRVHLHEPKETQSLFSAYIDVERLKAQDVLLDEYGRTANAIPVRGTKYLLNKDYKIVGRQRVFNKKWVVYVSGYSVDNESKYIFVDDDGYIVNLL